MSICNSTLSISFSISGRTFIQTAVVYYAYTAVAYSFYRSYYISIFTVYYSNESQVNDGDTVITAACSAGAAVVVVAVLVVVLIKIRSRKHVIQKQDK